MIELDQEQKQTEKGNTYECKYKCSYQGKKLVYNAAKMKY